MPPKKNKVVEDKSFGMKNKKGGKAQKYLASMATAGKSKEAMAKEQQKLEKAKEKEREQKNKAELAELFKPIMIQQKVPFGMDPKSILCEYFKQGTCTKGDRCKFSHNLNVTNKSAKIDIYTDVRRQEEEKKKNDLMTDWDEAKLQDVVNKKQGKNKATETEIVCKYFIDAIESEKYGWFWECANGVNCKYRHALPPGFVLKKKGDKEDKKKEISIEEFLESERFKLGSNLTPLTEETFKKWKEKRRAEQEEKEKAEATKRANLLRQGKTHDATGRELFGHDPTKYQTYDEEDAWEGDYSTREEEAEAKQRQQQEQQQQAALSVI